MLSSTTRRLLTSSSRTLVRQVSTEAKNHYKVVVVGSGRRIYVLQEGNQLSALTGSAGLSVANQIYNRFKEAGTPLNKGDIAILDAAEDHFYQPGW